ncbi:hypothetical protein JJL56_02005 [Azospirillum sp. YIM DDC1]|uniref:Paraquat-inducible protein A n=1 Tax=Azospirillum aestuarii TaxID=2802052 RepID=A0ABS1HS37_9PROT|nr:hypothetical protein [Azospirillum aestuarii]MBK4717633.1 hypothetical protein [Azospirillum aestuarii]
MLWLTAGMLMADHPQIIPHMLMNSWLVDAAPPIVQAALSVELSIGLALVLASGFLPILVVHQSACMVVKAIWQESLSIGDIVTVTLMATGMLAFLVAAYGFEAPLLIAADAVLALGVLAGISRFIARLIEDLRRPRGFGIFAVHPNHTAKDASDE